MPGFPGDMRGLADLPDVSAVITLVGYDGCLQTHNQASKTIGEPVGIRTRDLLIKSQLLYRLSYRPTWRLGT